MLNCSGLKWSDWSDLADLSDWWDLADFSDWSDWSDGGGCWICPLEVGGRGVILQLK